LERLTVTASEAGEGGGIYVDGGGLTATDLVVQGCTGTVGGGLWLINTTEVVIDGFDISGNLAAYSCGGICVDTGGPVRLTGGVIRENLAEAIAGLGLRMVDAVLEDVEIADNVGSGCCAGGLAVFYGLVDGARVDIHGNTSEADAGASLYRTTASGLEIHDNEALRFNGGMGVQDEVWLAQVSITGNRSESGAGIGSISTADVHLEDCVVTGNTATLAGGGATVFGTLESISTDWGEAESENVPDDVALYGGGEPYWSPTYSGYAAAADFVCSSTTATCDPPP